MKRLINKWLGQDMTELQGKISKLEIENSRLKSEVDFIGRRCKDKESEIKRSEEMKETAVRLKLKAQEENDELKKKVREQTEADLYLEAVKIARRIEEGEKVAKDDDSYKRMARYQQSLRAKSIGSPQYPSGGLLGSITNNALSGRLGL